MAWKRTTAGKSLVGIRFAGREIARKQQRFIEKISTELFNLLINLDGILSEFMGKAFNYFKKFWSQIFAYRNDGEYSIDNLSAERILKPIIVQQRIACASVL